MAEPQIPDVFNHYLPLGWTNQQEPIPVNDILVWPAASNYYYIASSGTNTALVKNGFTNLFFLGAFNTNANFPRYLRLFGQPTLPMVGIDTPLREVVIPAGGAIMISSDAGETYSTGIGFTITGGPGSDDTTPINALEVTLFFGYQ